MMPSMKNAAGFMLSPRFEGPDASPTSGPKSMSVVPVGVADDGDGAVLVHALSEQVCECAREERVGCDLCGGHPGLLCRLGLSRPTAVKLAEPGTPVKIEMWIGQTCLERIKPDSRAHSGH